MSAILKMVFQTEKDVELVLEPWGHVERIKRGQKVQFEYRDAIDSDGNSLWPIVAHLENGAIMFDIPSIDFRASINGEPFLECWD